MNDSDGIIATGIGLAGGIATASTDTHGHREMNAVLEGGNHMLGIDEVELGGNEEVLASHNRRTVDVNRGSCLVSNVVGLKNKTLNIENDVRHVLANSGQGLELVLHAFDVNRLDSSAVKRRQQNAAKRVAQGVTKTTLERLNREAGKGFTDSLDGNLRPDEL